VRLNLLRENRNVIVYGFEYYTDFFIVVNKRMNYETYDNTSVTAEPSTQQTPQTPPTQPTIVIESKPLTDEEKNTIKLGAGMGITVLVLIFLWGLAGFVAFIMSIVCFGRSGSTAEKIVGLFISLFLGPFYWIYYGVSKTYCKKTLAGGRRR
jgi:hypothetical protein